MAEEIQIAGPPSDPQGIRPNDAERPEVVMARRYAPPDATSAREVHPKPVSFAGFVLYLAFVVAFVASAFEVFPLGSEHEADTLILGGIAGAYTLGRYSRSRWAGFGIGLLVAFLAIGLAIYVRHAVA